MHDVTHYQSRLGTLKSERETFMPHWRDIADHMMTRNSRFLVEDRNRGGKKNDKVLNERPVLALRTLSSGMMSGMTNPARPWIALRTPDPDLNEYKPVKLFLETTRNRMLEIFLRSNVYTTLPLAYKDEGGMGVTAYLALEDPMSLLRTYHYPIGSYMLAADHRNRMNTCYREFSMGSAQMVAKFGKANCSQTVINMANKPAGKDSWVPVVHAIEENSDFHPGKSHFSAYKKFTSCYFEAGGDARTVLQRGGFDTFPVLAPRWDVTGEDVYGSDSPGMQALGAARQLMLREKRKGQLLDKGTSPAMTAPSSLRKERHSLLSGDVTYLDNSSTGQKFEPAYTPHPQWYQFAQEDSAALENRISRTFFEDLFLMLANDTRSNVTAREIAERHEEKLLQLGPVLLRQNDEHYDPLIDLTFDIMFRNKVLPPVPLELRDMDLGVEYISILAQAMKLVGVASLERGMNFASGMIASWPEVRYMVDPFNAVSEYFNTIGVSPKVMRDKKEVDQLVAAEAKKQQAMQQAAMVQPAAETAKTLADTKLDEGENALGRISEMMGAAA